MACKPYGVKTIVERTVLQYIHFYVPTGFMPGLDAEGPSGLATPSIADLYGSDVSAYSFGSPWSNFLVRNSSTNPTDASVPTGDSEQGNGRVSRWLPLLPLTHGYSQRTVG